MLDPCCKEDEPPLDVGGFKFGVELNNLAIILDRLDGRLYSYA